MWAYWPIVLGTLVVCFTLREVFRDLFHPSASGSLSDFVAGTTFRLFRHAPRLLSNAGPLAIVLVIVIWALSVCLGFALIYWGLPPQFFQVKSGQPATGFLPMIYFSLEIFTTLGLGDYAPLPIWLRILATLEALIGFGVLTASVSSIVLLHLALARTRTLARRLSLVVRSESPLHLANERAETEHLLAKFSSEIVRARVDLIQLPVVYYFYTDHKDASLPRILPQVLKLTQTQATHDEDESSRRASALLGLALGDLAEVLRDRFVHCATSETRAIFAAYNLHHSPAQQKHS